MKKLRIAMLAPPWLKIPPDGYGGIEYVVHYLTVELRKMGHDVQLFSTGDTTTPATQNHWFYEDGQYRHIHRQLYDAVTLPITQVLFSLKAVRDAGDFDIIHDHNGFLGPAVMSNLDPNHFPPVLHTLHGPFSTDEMVRKGMPDNRPMYAQFQYSDRLRFVGISKQQLTFAPKQLQPSLMGAVYNSLNLNDYPFVERPDREDYFITLARFTRDKGQAVAAHLAEDLGVKLRMAGVVDGIANPRQLLVEMANVNSPHRSQADFIYFRDEILPLLIPRQIEYIGEVKGETKMRFLSRSKALLFPIDWEEPFGMSVIEANACGTPVVAMNRGAMPELIVHGRNGFLAKTEAQFKKYMQRVDEIDPAECRKIVAERFSSKVMAEQYLDRYMEILANIK